MARPSVTRSFDPKKPKIMSKNAQFGAEGNFALKSEDFGFLQSLWSCFEAYGLGRIGINSNIKSDEI